MQCFSREQCKTHRLGTLNSFSVPWHNLNEQGAYPWPSRFSVIAYPLSAKSSSAATGNCTTNPSCRLPPYVRDCLLPPPVRVHFQSEREVDMTISPSPPASGGLRRPERYQDMCLRAPKTLPYPAPALDTWLPYCQDPFYRSQLRKPPTHGGAITPSRDCACKKIPISSPQIPQINNQPEIAIPYLTN